MISIFSRLSLVSLIVYGGYMVFTEQRIIRICEDEVRSLEKSFESRLDSRSTTLDFCNLSTDPAFFSWLYHAPPNKSFTIEILSKESGEVLTTTMLRIPSQANGHYGIIDLQFNLQAASPPLIKQLNVYGPNFLKAEKPSGNDSQFKSPKFLGFVVPNKSDAFAAIKEKQMRPMPFFYIDTRAQATTQVCRPGAPLALCYFSEEESAGAPLLHREYVIQVSADD